MPSILRTLLLPFFVMVFSLVSMSALGQATVTSDKDDYAPRSNAVFTGSGFAAFEKVNLRVKNLDRACNTVTADSSYLPWTVTADANGGFRTDWLVCDCPGDSLRLKATGLTSGLIAYAYFTDAPTVTSVSPNSGSTSGGNIVTIIGEGFLSNGTISVAFGGVSATDIKRVDNKTLTCKVPANTIGLVNVSVTLSGSGLGNSGTGTLNNSYTYTNTKQSIIFNELPTNKIYGNEDFSPGATASSGLTVSYISTNTNVATITSDGNIHIVGAGTTNIIASQAGNKDYEEAISITRTLNVGKASLVVTTNAATKVYGQANPSFSVSYATFVNGDTKDDLGGTLGFATSATAASAVGAYDVTPNGLTSSNYNIQFVKGTLSVTKALAILEYTGTEFMNTANASTSVVTVPISVQLNSNAIGGDITTAKVYFTITSPSGNTIPQVVNCSNNTTLSKDGDGYYLMINQGSGLASACLKVDLGTSNSGTYEIVFKVGGNYESTSSDVLITVAKPLGDFITGGGHLKNPTITTSAILPSGGKYKADPGTKTNFSFNVKFNKTGTSLQGGMNIVVRSGGKIHHYKTNSLTYLGVKVNDQTIPLSNGKYGSSATFTAKASLLDVTNPLYPVSLGGGLIVTVTMKDKGEPGKEMDMIAITIKDGNELLFSSNYDAATQQTVERVINGGNLTANSSSNVGKTATVQQLAAAPQQIELAQTAKFNLSVFPNPSANLFNLKLESSNGTEKIIVRVIDLQGRTVQLFNNLVAGQTLQLGSNYRPGVYFVEMIQGSNRKQLQLIKRIN